VKYVILWHGKEMWYKDSLEELEKAMKWYKSFLIEITYKELW